MRVNAQADAQRWVLRSFESGARRDATARHAGDQHRPPNTHKPARLTLGGLSLVIIIHVA
jgi:hypothetical protein